MSRKTQHVVPNPKGGWSVRSSGARKASRVFDTQAAAIKHAESLSSKYNNELMIHSTDGTISKSANYTDNPNSQTDKK